MRIKRPHYKTIKRQLIKSIKCFICHRLGIVSPAHLYQYGQLMCPSCGKSYNKRTTANDIIKDALIGADHDEE